MGSRAEITVTYANAHVHVLTALNAGLEATGFEVVGVDVDNVSEFFNKPGIAWAAEQSIFRARSRPHRMNEGASVEPGPPSSARPPPPTGTKSRGTGRAQPRAAAGQRPVQLPDPDQEADRLGN